MTVSVSPASARPPAPDGAPPDPGGRATAYLHAGQVKAARWPTAITTILGSCVSVCLHDPVARTGGMNHFLLPLPVARERSARFGTIAMEGLFDAVVAAGARRERLVAKVFGGASVIGSFRGSRNLGEENVKLALRLLEEARVPVLEHDVLGELGRKLVFHTDDGSAWVRQL